MNSPAERPEDGERAVVAGAPGALDSRSLLVERVVQDESFRRAPRLKELLTFLTARAIDGRAAELNEHEIACAVFRRPATFNPSDDSIVRSSVRQLRTKLHEYFEGPGQGEAVTIEIPKGSYVPEFPARPAAAASEPDRRAERAVRLWRGAALAGIAAAVVFAALWLMGPAKSGVGGGAVKAPNLVTWLFGGHGQEVNIVVCDSALVVVNSYRERMLNLEQYIQQQDQQRLPLAGGKPAGATPPEFPGKRLITSFRDMAFVERLSEESGAAGFQVALKHSRLMQARDFRTGNHILLGSSWSNPWTMLFEEQLNFRFREDPSTGTFAIANAAPQAGEPALYQCSPAQARDGVSYARIAIVPNLSGRQAILLVSGLHTESSEGALDAVLSPDFLAQLRSSTGARSPEQLIGVELLMEVRAVDGVVRGTRLVARRGRR